MEQGLRRPRIADVAREAGVSKTAVSFAFNSPDRLAPETAVRIREIADTLGYRPHPVARMLTQRETLSIGVLTSDDGPFYDIRELSETAEEVRQRALQEAREQGRKSNASFERS